MAGNTRDVDLIIRAKAEGERAIKSITDALTDLTGAQAGLAKTGRQTDAALQSLGTELNALSTQVQNLASFKKVVENVDRAGEAVERLEGRSKKTAEELAALAAKQAEAAAATQRARDAVEQANAAYEAQRAQAAAVKKEVGATSEAYQQQALALQQARDARTQANSALGLAEREERKLQGAVEKVTVDLEQQNTALATSKASWQELRQAAQNTGQQLGGVDANLTAIGNAANQAAEKLQNARNAVDFEQQATKARKLREAADYVSFWSDALNRKEQVEREVAERQTAAAQFEADAAAARKLRESTEYVQFWTKALHEKEAAEAQAAAHASEVAQADAQMAAAASRLRAQIDPLSVIQADLNKKLKEARDLYNQGRISAVELAQAERMLAKNADDAAQAIGRQSAAGGKGTFLGLRPYELQNLSYQVNDVFTQLGSGAPVMQVFAQQGGQLFQIFQRQLIPAVARIGPAIAAAAPEIAILLAAVVALGAAFKNAADEASSIKQFSTELKASADGSLYNAKALAETAHRLDVYGMSLEDARAALKQFTQDGLNPELLEKFGRAAENVSIVTGKKIPEAAKLMSDGFRGGYDAIKKLDDEFNFLTATERDHIRAMFDSGDAARGRTEAFDIFYKKMKEGADNMRGPWGESLRNFAAAWNNLVEWIKNTAPVQAAIKLISELSKKIKELTDLLPGAEANNEGDAAGTTPGTLRLERELTDLRKKRADAAERQAKIEASIAKYKEDQARAEAEGRRIAPRYYDPKMDTGETVADLDKQIAEKEKQLAELKTQLSDTKAESSEHDKKVLSDVLDQLSEEELRRKANLKTTTDADKIRIAGELAYRQAMRETADVGEETARRIAEARRKAAEDQVRQQQANSLSYGTFAQKVAGIESGGNNNAKNPLSTATGQGQFIESTWLTLFRKYFPDEAARMSEEAILELRKRQEYSLKMIEIYAQENSALLQKAGVSVNEAALYLAHFLGPGGATKVLKADPNTPVSQLLSPGQIAANRSILDGKTAGQVIGFAERKTGTSDAEREVLADRAAVTNKLNEATRQYNDTLDDQSSKRTAEIGALKQLSEIEKLNLEQKYQANRQAEIEKEVEEARQKAVAAGTTLSTKREQQIRNEVGQLYDLKHAEELHNAQLKEKRDFIQNVLGLEQQRETALRELNAELTSGTTDESRVEELRKQIADLTKQIEEAIPKAREFAAALGDEKAVANLDKVNLKLKTQREEIRFSKDVTSAFMSSFTSAFDSFSQAIAAGEKPLKALRNAFLQFASDFLRQIAQMILKQALFNMLGVGKDGSSGLGNVLGSVIGGLFHTGGVAGVSAAPSRSVPSAWFANAARYHTGGVVGLQPDEVPAILQRNEEVLTSDDPRHRFNLGKGDAGPTAAPQVNLKVINAIDPGEFISAGLNTRDGEQGFLNYIRQNQGAVNQALGRG